MSDTTQIGRVFICQSCGANASLEQEIKHFDGCRQGDSEVWRQFYLQAEQSSDEVEPARIILEQEKQVEYLTNGSIRTRVHTRRSQCLS